VTSSGNVNHYLLNMISYFFYWGLLLLNEIWSFYNNGQIQNQDGVSHFYTLVHRYL